MYITAAAATAILQGEGSVEDWPATAAEQGKFLERSSRRIDQLAFAPAHETPQSPRYTDGFLTGAAKVADNAIPHNLAVEVALLALWYAQNPNGFYNRSPAGEESLCKQMSDMPLSIQTGLWAFVSDEVKIDADELPASKQDRQPAGSLSGGTPAADASPSTGGPGVDQEAREIAEEAKSTADLALQRIKAVVASGTTPPPKATNADVDGETDDTGYTTVLKVFRAIARKVRAASTTAAGLIEIATAGEADAGAATDKAMTPSLTKRLIDKIRQLPKTTRSEAGRYLVVSSQGDIVASPEPTLPEYPATGSRDNKVPKFDGDTLKWEEDATGGSANDQTARTAAAAAQSKAAENEKKVDAAAEAIDVNIKAINAARGSISDIHAEFDALGVNIVYRDFKPWPIVNDTTKVAQYGYGIHSVSSIPNAATMRGLGGNPANFLGQSEIGHRLARYIIMRVPRGIDQKSVNVKITRKDNDADVETTTGKWRLVTHDNDFNYYILRNAANTADRRITATSAIWVLRMQVGTRQYIVPRPGVVNATASGNVAKHQPMLLEEFGGQLRVFTNAATLKIQNPQVIAIDAVDNNKMGEFLQHGFIAADGELQNLTVYSADSTKLPTGASPYNIYWRKVAVGAGITGAQKIAGTAQTTYFSLTPGDTPEEQTPIGKADTIVVGSGNFSKPALYLVTGGLIDMRKLPFSPVGNPQPPSGGVLKVAAYKQNPDAGKFVNDSTFIDLFDSDLKFTPESAAAVYMVEVSGERAFFVNGQQELKVRVRDITGGASNTIVQIELENHPGPSSVFGRQIWTPGVTTERTIEVQIAASANRAGIYNANIVIWRIA